MPDLLFLDFLGFPALFRKVSEWAVSEFPKLPLTWSPYRPPLPHVPPVRFARRKLPCIGSQLPAPHARALGPLDFHDATVRVRGEHAGTGRLAQPLHLAAQLAVLFLKFEDARDSSQVDALLLAELLRLREP